MKKIGVRFLSAFTAVSLLFANTSILTKNNASNEERTGKIRSKNEPLFKAIFPEVAETVEILVDFLWKQ